MNDTETYYQPIFHDNGTISVVAGDSTYDHTYADRPMNEAVVETSHSKPNPTNWKHVVSNCDERWNLIDWIGRLPYYYFLLLLSYSAKKKGRIT